MLSLFNDVSQLTYGEISVKTTIPKKRLDAALVALCNPKNQVLEKEIKKATFDNDNEKISINFKFQNA